MNASAYVTDSATSISSRFEDKDGRLFVGPSVLTRAGVDSYFGGEVEGCDELGLEKDREYRFLRSPEELKKALPRMETLPLTTEHVTLSARDHDESKIIGAIGSGAAYDDSTDVVRAPLSVWREPFIGRIKSGDQKEISMGYRFRPVMTPGVWNGKPYDGIMTEIEPNHFALVPAGRVNINSDGPLAAVADAANTGGKTVADTKPEDDKKPAAKVGDEGGERNPLDCLVDALRMFAPDVDDDKLRAAGTQLIAALNASTPGAEAGGVGDEERVGCMTGDEQTLADREKESAGEKARLEKDKIDREHERAGMEARVGDAVRANIRAEIMAEVRKMDAAKEDVRGVVGAAAIVGDSGGAIYRSALRTLGIPDADKMGDDEAARTFRIVKAQRNARHTVVVGDSSATVGDAASIRKAIGLDRFKPAQGVA